MSKQLFGEETRQSLHDLADALRRERDQLNIQANLGKMELRDEWEEVEKKWQDFEQKVQEATDDSKQSLHELGQEVAAVYRRMKRHLD